MADDKDCAGKALSEFRMAQILDALESLTELHSYPSITVKMICDEARISRPTFYHYFKDKDDILQWYWDQSGERHLRQTGRSLDWYESNLNMLCEFQQHARLMKEALACDTGVNSCINHGFRQRVKYLTELVKERGPMGFNEDLDFEIRFFADAESRAITRWVKTGMVEKPEVIARRIEGCVPARLRRAVDDILANGDLRP